MLATRVATVTLQRSRVADNPRPVALSHASRSRGYDSDGLSLSCLMHLSALHTCLIIIVRLYTLYLKPGPGVWSDFVILFLFVFNFASAILNVNLCFNHIVLNHCYKI